MVPCHYGMALMGCRPGVGETHSTIAINLLESMKPSPGCCLLEVLGGGDESLGPQWGDLQRGQALGLAVETTQVWPQLLAGLMDLPVNIFVQRTAQTCPHVPPNTKCHPFTVAHGEG